MRNSKCRRQADTDIVDKTKTCNLAISVLCQFKQPKRFHSVYYYIVLAPQVMAEDHENNGLILKLIICLIAAASAAVVVTVYHCITARYMRPSSLEWLPPREVQLQQQQEISVSMDNSVAELLPARKYKKGEAGLVGADDGTCSICLCEFEDDEELRTLPECSHSFHVACIDMWLYSHWSCPMCRSVVGVLGPSSPALMHFLRPIPSNMHNTSPIETL